MASQDQPSFSGEKAPERRINFTPPLEQRAEHATATQADQPTNNVKVTEDKMVVPPIAVKGWQGDSTTGNTSLPPYLNLSNPYDSWGLTIAGRKWTDMSGISKPFDSRPASGDAPTVSDATPAPGRRLEPGDVNNQKLLDAAKGLVDQKVWQGSQFEHSTLNGKLGGAASLSRILEGQGYDITGSANVSKLTNSMLANGWQLVGMTDAKPGDIVFGGKTGTDWRAGGGNGRVGIVGEDGKIYYNQPESGKWALADRQTAFGKEFGDQVWVLRPPAGGPQHPGRTAPQNESADTLERRGRRSHREEGPQDYDQPRRRGHRARREEGSPDFNEPQRRGRGQRNEDPYSNFRDPSGRNNWPSPDNGSYAPQNSEAKFDLNPFSILQHAVEGVGKALWAMTPFRNSVNNGRLGCAASVSKVLQNAGYRYASSAGVGGLEGQLMKNGWTKAPLSQAAAGDVVMVGRSHGWRNGGGSAHVGVVGEHGSVYHNSSSRGQWVKDNLQARFGGGMERFVLKPPANGRHNIDPRSFANLNPEPEVVPSRRAGHDYGRQPDFGRQDFGRQDFGRNDRRTAYQGGYGDQDRYNQPRYDQQRYDQSRYNQDPSVFNREDMDPRRSGDSRQRQAERYREMMEERYGRQRHHRRRR